MTECVNVHSLEPDWVSARQDLSVVFHRLASAYEDGGRFADAVRIYLHELSIREASQRETRKEIAQCHLCLARVYENMGNKLEANHQRLRARRLSGEVFIGNRPAIEGAGAGVVVGLGSATSINFSP